MEEGREERKGKGRWKKGKGMEGERKKEGKERGKREKGKG